MEDLIGGGRECTTILQCSNIPGRRRRRLKGSRNSELISEYRKNSSSDLPYLNCIILKSVKNLKSSNSLIPLLLLALIFLLPTAQAILFEGGCPQPPPNPANGRVIQSELKCDDGFELFPMGKNGEDGSITCDLDKKEWIISSYCAANIAKNRPMNLSSSMSRQQQQQKGSDCFGTGKETSPWVRIDLLRFYAVLSVRIRADGAIPINDLEIRVGNSSTIGKNPLCTWSPEGVKQEETSLFSCARPLVGRFVSIQIVGEKETSLAACDIQVYSTSEIPTQRCKPDDSAGDVISFDGVCYEFSITNGQSFDGARSQCKARGGDLLTNLGDGPTLNLVTNKLESIKDRLKRPLIWIGVVRSPGFTSRTWRYVDTNEVVKKPNWAKNQPTYIGEQNCVALDGGVGRDWGWNDVSCALDYFNWICQFPTRLCGTPSKAQGVLILNEKPDSLYPIGFELEYSCKEGHYLEYKKTANKRKCLSTGYWEDVEELPTCKYSNCGEFKLGSTTFENGKIISLDNRTDFGAKVKLDCDKDYLLDHGSGLDTLGFECGKDEKWVMSRTSFGRTNFNGIDIAKNPPKCLYSKCPLSSEGEIINGTYESNGNSVGSTIRYKCNEGHLLIGSSALKCLLGGKWDNPYPTCMFIDCGTPPTLTNAGIEKGTLTTTSLGSSVNYECLDNYEGGGEWTCSEDGTWRKSEDFEPCEMISCGKPQVPIGGFAIGYDYDVGSIIEYRCDVGYALRGVQTRTCLKSGEWSNDMPQCEYIDCKHSQPSPHSSLVYLNGTTHLGSVVKYTCSPNYKLARSRINFNGMRRCGNTGAWEGPLPKCEEVRCRQPSIPPNSLITVTLNDRSSLKLINSDHQSTQTYRIGSIVKFRCERGHILKGDSGLTCEDGGEWSGSSPSCQYVDCGDPGSVDNAGINLINNQTYFGAAVIYECNPGYRGVGLGSRRICGDNGQWSNSTPFKCEMITCEELKEASSNRPGSIAYYTCPLGMYLAGPRERRCLANGTWDGHAPNCLWSTCPPPPVPSSPLIRLINLNDSLIYNSVVEFHCSRGYELKGPSLIVCNGTHWLPDIFPEGRAIQECAEITYNPADEIKALPITLGLIFGLLIVMGFIGILVYLKRGWRSNKGGNAKEEMSRASDLNGSSEGGFVAGGNGNNNSNGVTGMSVNGSPMVVYSYYDNPTTDPIYENLDDEDPYGFGGSQAGGGRSSDSVVTINGVAIT